MWLDEVVLERLGVGFQDWYVVVCGLMWLILEGFGYYGLKIINVVCGFIDCAGKVRSG